MVDLLNIFFSRHNISHTYKYQSLARWPVIGGDSGSCIWLVTFIHSLNRGGENGTDLVINPHSYKVDRFENYDFGHPFLSSPEHIFTLKPEVEVCFKLKDTGCLKQSVIPDKMAISYGP